MRKIIYAINLTADGCCDHTKVVPDDELLEYHARLARGVDALIFGRITYQLMVPYWPDVARNPSGQTKADVDFARAFDSVSRIIVFSKSLATTEDDRARIVRADLQHEVLKLKQEEGKDMLVGGVSIPSQLMKLGLIDEYRFVVQPRIAGEGRRLFDGVALPEALRLTLVESTALKSGCIALRYLKQ